MNRKLLAVPAAIAAVLAIASVAQAHDFDIGASCDVGLHVTLTNYSGVDNVTVWIDGHRVTDTTFQRSYTLHLDFDKTTAHTWRVKVDGHGEKSPDRHGRVDACVTPPTTTTVPPTTIEATTTTSAVAPSTTTTVATPPPALPATGTSTAPLALIAFGLLVGGIAVTGRGRRA